MCLRFETPWNPRYYNQRFHFCFEMSQLSTFVSVSVSSALPKATSQMLAHVYHLL